MSKIKAIKSREILDSRGNPTIEVDLKTDEGIFRAAVPSGASTGVHEALELRDKDKRYNGRGVLTAVGNVNNIISKKIIGMDPAKQNEIDELMIKLDGTKNKSKLGANAILGVSMAVCRAGAESKKIQLYQHINEIFGKKTLMRLPVPFFNVINGGKHAGNQIDFQEYMIAPVKAKDFHEALRMGAETYAALKEILMKKYGKSAINVGDEGGFAPPLTKIEEPLQMIIEAISNAGYKQTIKIGMDVAASSFFKDGSYIVEGKKINSAQLTSKYESLSRSYPIISIEDPFDEESYDDFAELKKRIGRSIQIVGDDLLVTNVERIREAIKRNSCSALLLKVNQIGTVTEALDAAKLAYDSKMQVMVSHRSGETSDSFIADLAVGIGCGQIKSGAPCRSERLAKYNQLLRIEEEIKLAYGLKG